MKKSDIFNMVLDKVVEVCEVRKESILNRLKVNSVVDARILLVYILRRLGLTNDDIALVILRTTLGRVPDLEEIKIKAKNVNKLFMMYSDRYQSFAFRQMAKELCEYAKGIESDANQTA